MLAIGDKVITMTNDTLDGFTGVVRGIWDDGYSISLDEEPGRHWFGFNEVRKVEG